MERKAYREGRGAKAKYFHEDDPRFIGQGNPPSLPHAKAGMGRLQLVRADVPDRKTYQKRGKDPMIPDNAGSTEPGQAK